MARNRKLKTAPEPKRYATVEDLMAAREKTGAVFPPIASITIPSGIYPKPGSAGIRQSYADAMRFIDVLTGTKSTLIDAAAGGEPREVEAPEPVIVQGDIETREIPVIEPPHDLGL